MSVVLSDGEVCKGRWAQVPVPDKHEGPATAPADPMASDWDTVYGQGFYVANVLGTRLFARASLTGDRGTTLRVELYRTDTRHSEDQVKGVARDNRENLYKVIS
jgi:hypothetical protein